MKKGFTIDDIKNSPVAHLNKHLWDDQPKKKEKKKSKYNNQKVEFDGHSFDSLKERDRYITNRQRLLSGEIESLELQVEFILETDDKKVCSYIADSVYKIVSTGKLVVEDVKSPQTRRLAVYRLKKKLMMACLGINIKEI